jgi:hypothetical protein
LEERRKKEKERGGRRSTRQAGLSDGNLDTGEEGEEVLRASACSVLST